MAFALRKTSRRGFESLPSSVCRVHTCFRCKAAVQSAEPCSFMPEVIQVCPGCAGQEQVLRHLPGPGKVWGAGLAGTYRP
jgi:hypothetical protein